MTYSTETCYLSAAVHGVDPGVQILVYITQGCKREFF